jgi:hypothetical protein
MTFTPYIEQWLQQAGYEYHCFISWPHTENKEITDCAKYIRDAITNGLALSVPSPKVFLDETSMIAGSEWPLSLRHALCKSIAMVAICAPIYYHPAHEWCGLEWAAMELLGQKRLPNEDLKAIIPIMVRTSSSLPRVVSKVQYVDLSSVTIRGRRYYNTQEFKEKVRNIVESIEKIAVALTHNQSKPNCERFRFPSSSAFGDYQPQSQPLPFRNR